MFCPLRSINHLKSLKLWKNCGLENINIKHKKNLYKARPVYTIVSAVMSFPEESHVYILCTRFFLFFHFIFSRIFWILCIRWRDARLACVLVCAHRRLSLRSVVWRVIGCILWFAPSRMSQRATLTSSSREREQGKKYFGLVVQKELFCLTV